MDWQAHVKEALERWGPALKKLGEWPCGEHFGPAQSCPKCDSALEVLGSGVKCTKCDWYWLVEREPVCRCGHVEGDHDAGECWAMDEQGIDNGLLIQCSCVGWEPTP